MPIIGDAIPRVRNALGDVFEAGRDRMTLVIILLIVLGGVILVFAYLILRRR